MDRNPSETGEHCSTSSSSHATLTRTNSSTNPGHLNFMNGPCKHSCSPVTVSKRKMWISPFTAVRKAKAATTAAEFRVISVELHRPRDAKSLHVTAAVKTSLWRIGGSRDRNVRLTRPTWVTGRREGKWNAPEDQRILRELLSGWWNKWNMSSSSSSSFYHRPHVFMFRHYLLTLWVTWF